MKGIEHSEMEKGDLLTDEAIKPATEIEVSLNLSGLAKEDIAIGRVYGFASGFNYTNASIISLSGGQAKLKLDRPICLQKDDRFLLMRERAPRIFGGGKITGIA